MGKIVVDLVKGKISLFYFALFLAVKNFKEDFTLWHRLEKMVL